MYGPEVSGCKHCLYIFLANKVTVIFSHGSHKFIRGTGVVEVTRKDRFVDGISCLVLTLGHILCRGLPNRF
jgi:hypothetical protein